MKKLLLSVFCVMLLAGVSYAQNYKPFKLGLGLGYASPGKGGGGVLFALEPAYRVNDAIAVGLKMEAAGMARVSPDGSTGSASLNGSYSLNGQYYLSDNTFRPYVGAGLGLFSVASGAVSVGGTDATASAGVGRHFGFYPRLGFDLGHFNVNLDYSFISPTKAETVNTNGTIGTTKLNNNYLGLRIGAFIGGGRR